MTIINDNCWWWILIMVTDGQTDGLTTRYHDQKQAKNGLQSRFGWHGLSLTIMDCHGLSWTVMDYPRLDFIYG